MKYARTFTILIVFFLFQQIGHAKIYCKIKGRVIDAETKTGIADVYVNAHLFRHDSPKDHYVMTDEKGYFTFSNLAAGRYKLNYAPLYPYSVIPAQKHMQLDWKNSFVIAPGEIKYITQALQKGGEVILNYILPVGDISEYGYENFLMVRVEGDEYIRNIDTVTHKWDNPRFKKAINGIKLNGLAPGEYIISRSLKKKSKYCTGQDVEYVGLVRIFNLGKLEKKQLDLDYNLASEIILNIKDKNGNKFHRGSIALYKEVSVNNKTGFFRVWSYRYRKNEVINPIVTEPGKYFITLFYGGELIRQDGSIIKFEGNDFLVNIKEGESQQINLVVSLGEKILPGYDKMTFFCW